MDLSLFCYWEGGMCVISWCSKRPSSLNAKPQKPFLPQRPESPQETVIGHREVLPLQHAARLFCFFVNVTRNTWPGLSALSVCFCVEMNESFFLNLYRNALCENHRGIFEAAELSRSSRKAPRCMILLYTEQVLNLPGPTVFITRLV